MPNNARAIDALPAADYDEIRAAHAAGVSVVRYREMNKTAPSEQERAAKRVNPYAPYRSKWELQYAEHLTLLARTGRIVTWVYEADSLEIGIKAKYTPDFFVSFKGGRIECHEVKGYRREAAMVRIKAAAKQYPQYKFVLVTRKDGQWDYTTIGAQR